MLNNDYIDEVVLERWPSAKVEKGNLTSDDEIKMDGTQWLFQEKLGFL